jgi:hypothetical protein
VGNYIRVIDFKEILKPGEKSIRKPSTEVYVFLYIQFPKFQGLYFLVCRHEWVFNSYRKIDEYWSLSVVQEMDRNAVGAGCSIPLICIVPLQC